MQGSHGRQAVGRGWNPHFDITSRHQDPGERRHLDFRAEITLIGDKGKLKQNSRLNSTGRCRSASAGQTDRRCWERNPSLSGFTPGIHPDNYPACLNRRSAKLQGLCRPKAPAGASQANRPNAGRAEQAFLGNCAGINPGAWDNSGAKRNRAGNGRGATERPQQCRRWSAWGGRWWALPQQPAATRKRARRRKRPTADTSLAGGGERMQLREQRRTPRCLWGAS